MNALTRLDKWRRAVDLSSGPSAVDTVTRLRDHLGNDLDTPRALAAIDAWADEALSHGGSDSHGPSQIRTAVDALLGVEL